MKSLVTLYRPVGPRELALVEQSEMRRFPPRLPEQPFFYPVENERYAREIADRWNVRDSDAGFVTRFAVDADDLARYELQKVGTHDHLESWIPAEESDDSTITSSVRSTSSTRTRAELDRFSELPSRFASAMRRNVGTIDHERTSMATPNGLKEARTILDNNQPTVANEAASSSTNATTSETTSKDRDPANA